MNGADLSYIALGHKIWVGSLTKDMCNPLLLGPLLERPPGSTAEDPSRPPLPLRDVQISTSRRCCVATYKTRLAALTALQCFDRRPISISSAGVKHRELSAGWALKHATLRVSDLSSEVSREHLERAFAAHGELAPGPSSVEIEYDRDGNMTGVAYITYALRGTACRVAAMCAENLFIIAGNMVPARVDFAPGAVDDDDVPGILDARAPYEAGRDLLDAVTRAFMDDNHLALLVKDGQLPREVLEGDPDVSSAGTAAAAMAAAAAAALDSNGERADGLSGIAAEVADENSRQVQAGYTVSAVDGDLKPPKGGKGGTGGGGKRKRLDADGASSSSSSSSTSSLVASPKAASGPAATRIAKFQSLASHFAQPNTLEFEFAREWRELQQREVAEEARLKSLQYQRRARLLMAQRLRFLRQEAAKGEKLDNEHKKFLIHIADKNIRSHPDTQKNAAQALDAVGMTEEKWKAAVKQAYDAASERRWSAQPSGVQSSSSSAAVAQPSAASYGSSSSSAVAAAGYANSPYEPSPDGSGAGMGTPSYPPAPAPAAGAAASSMGGGGGGVPRKGPGGQQQPPNGGGGGIPRLGGPSSSSSSSSSAMPPPLPPGPGLGGPYGMPGYGGGGGGQQGYYGGGGGERMGGVGMMPPFPPPPPPPPSSSGPSAGPRPATKGWGSAGAKPNR